MKHHPTRIMGNRVCSGQNLNASYYTIEQPYTLMYTTASQASYIIETAPSVDFSGNEELRNAYMGEAFFGEHLRTITY